MLSRLQCRFYWFIKNVNNDMLLVKCTRSRCLWCRHYFKLVVPCVQVPPGHFIFPHLAMYCYTVLMFISYYCTINQEFIGGKGAWNSCSSMTIQNSYIMTLEILKDIIPVLIKCLSNSNSFRSTGISIQCFYTALLTSALMMVT